MKKSVPIYLSLLTILILLSCYFVVRDIRDINPIPEPKELPEDDQYYIDLNTASADDFQKIPGVGYKLANNIVAYREENGPFRQYSELLNVKGIGHNNLAVILDYVRINEGDTI